MPPEDNPADEVQPTKEEYEAYENRIDNDNTVMVTVRMPISKRNKLHIRAQQMKMSLNKFCLKLLLGE